MLHTVRNSKRLADLTINLLFSIIILFRIRIIASILIPLNYFTVTGWAKFLNSKQTWLMWMRDLLFLTEEVLKVTLCFHSKIISYFQKIQEISIWQAKLKDCQSFLDNASQPAPFPLCTAELKEKQLASFECPTIMWLHSWQVWNPARQDSAVNCTLNSSKAELEWVSEWYAVVVPRMCSAPWERVVVAWEPEGRASSGLRMLQRAWMSEAVGTRASAITAL